MDQETIKQNEQTEKTSRSFQFWVSWILTGALVAILISILYWQPILARELDEMNGVSHSIQVDSVADVSNEALANMPYFEVNIDEQFVERDTETLTIAPTRPRSKPIEYTVQSGDAVFSIANKYNITPETLLFSNYGVLKDDPHSLRPDQVLLIPPTNGILYEWEEGDTVEAVAQEFNAEVDEILNWTGNELDLTNPEIEPGKLVMIPGGERELNQSFYIRTIYAEGKSGVYTTIGGACEIGDVYNPGSGYFVWPADNHYLSGNDFWSGHLAIDIAAGTGAPIYAADSGVIVFAGWYSNYGNMVMIDHQNGYHTVYAHLNNINLSCGTIVYQGQIIGNAGSTGNSTGPHLHFEIRYMGAFVNPWDYLY